jgi:hypothetical protein
MKLEDILNSGNDTIINLNTGFYYTVRKSIANNPEDQYSIHKGRIGFPVSIERYPAPKEQVLAFFAGGLPDEWEILVKK